MRQVRKGMPRLSRPAGTRLSYRQSQSDDRQAEEAAVTATAAQDAHGSRQRHTITEYPGLLHRVLIVKR